MDLTDKLRSLQIKAHLVADKTVGMLEIESRVEGSLAVLTGEVENEEQKHIAEELAYGIDGIVDVRNYISVVMPSSAKRHAQFFSDHKISNNILRQFADADIESEVRSRLAKQREVDVSHVDISSLKEIVHLSGVVRNLEDLRRLKNIVLDCSGVTGICSEVVARG